MDQAAVTAPRWRESWKVVVMVATVAGAVMYATSWVDNRIITGQKNAQEVIVKTLQASLAETRTAIVTDVGTRIGTAETNLRAEIKTVDDRVHTHVANHPSWYTTLTPSELLELSPFIMGDPDPTRRVDPDLLRAALEVQQP